MTASYISATVPVVADFGDGVHVPVLFWSIDESGDICGFVLPADRSSPVEAFVLTGFQGYRYAKDEWAGRTMMAPPPIRPDPATMG